MKYTVFGDANLDGHVNVADLLALARSKHKPPTWDTGDFNYDGFVDRLDLSKYLTPFRVFSGAPPILSN